jgi:uncharacterized protein (TIGR03032 family)
MNPLHEKHHQMLRDPAQITGLWSESGIHPKLLEHDADKGWKRTLERLGVTLLVTREYEHLVLAINHQATTWIHLPHPSGLVVDHSKETVHLACTRNPNILMEFRGETLLPTRARFLPGSLYLHDLAIIGSDLYGNAVGQNAIVRLDYDLGDERVWWPKCIGDRKPVFDKNHIQLNSIAAGKTLKDSFFSATSDQVTQKVPGDPDFPVDGRGGIFSGRTREMVVRGLTRPHSVRFYKKELWVDNSGYGEVGPIIGNRFEPILKLESWTRGLCFVKDVLFVGVSKVLPKFHSYAPGLDHHKSRCGIVAIDPVSEKILGRITWPHGNQIFAIDWMKRACFPFGGKRDVKKTFYLFGDSR